MNLDECRTVENVNASLAQMLQRMRNSLCGRATFGGEDVKVLRALLSQMEPILPHSAELCRTRPAIALQLDLYRSQLLELQQISEKLRVALLVQRATLETKRDQIIAKSRWCSALQGTRE